MRQPTKMPQWLHKQFENAEKTVQTWSEGKREAAGVPSSCEAGRVTEPNPSMKPTVLCAAFCGTGKTYLCQKSNVNAIEIEYWKYKNLKEKFIQDIKEQIGEVDYIFLSTEIESLKLLHNEGLDIVLIYPKKELRNEYLDRYIIRDNPYDFIGTMMKYWDSTIDELQKQNYCKHIVLEKNQYIHNVLSLIV
jgi:hypothetical protein